MASINYNDSRFTEVEKDKNAAISQSNSTYDNLIKDSGKYYNNLISQSKDWAKEQANIQNQQTDFTIQKIEQQKDQAKKDYTKEQKGAYQDYMKQSNAYGSNMQGVGQQGLSGSGWSETIQAGFYNTYQNRYAQARESYNNIVMNYDNNIKEAQLQNSSALATIYANAQKEQLELALQNFTVIKDLSLAKQNAYLALDSEYNDRWREVESQINTENALAEEIRQYNESLAEQKRQYNEKMAEERRQYNETLAFQKSEAAREQANWEKEYALSKSKASGSGGGGSSGGISGGNSSVVLTENNNNKNNNNNNNKNNNDSNYYGEHYNVALQMATTLYTGGGVNKFKEIESILANFLSKGLITEAGAQHIINTINAGEAKGSGGGKGSSW